MDKERALDVVKELLSHWVSEWEGTSTFEKEYDKFINAVDYIETHLN